MPTINQLPTVTQVSGGDQFPLYLPSQGDARRCSVTTMIAFMEENFDAVIANTVKTTPVAYSFLPAANVAGLGTRAFVTDSTVNTFGATVAGGGAYMIPVYSNGTNWLVG